MKTITQYRFFWPYADEEMVGTSWREEPFTEEDKQDMDGCGFTEWWIEMRTVTYGEPARCTFQMPKVVFLIAAYNEENCIADTVLSIHAQTKQAYRIIVMADNCTDDTELIARAYGALAVPTVNNPHKKAGALNQGFKCLRKAGLLCDEDFLFVMDADSQIDSRFVEQAVMRMNQDSTLGGVGGTFQGGPGGGFVGMLQRNEYARYARDVHRRKGKILVLTGTATLFRIGALLDVIDKRGSGQLPKAAGVYDTKVLTEDNELTLALMHAGWRILSPKECTLTTEVMESWKDLSNQRLRWKRGALENLKDYGLTRITYSYWLRQLVSLVGVLVVVAYLISLVLSLVLVGRVSVPFVWMLVTAIFIFERVVSVNKRGWRQMVLASVLLVEMVFDFFLQWVHAKALLQTLLNKERKW